jgi:hypothetical protein
LVERGRWLGLRTADGREKGDGEGSDEPTATEALLSTVDSSLLG